jgi:hypothetical protein
MRRLLAVGLVLMVLAASAGAKDASPGEKKTGKQTLTLFDRTKSYFLGIIGIFRSADSSKTAQIAHPHPLGPQDCGSGRTCLQCYRDDATGQVYCPGDPGFDPCHEFQYPGPDVQQP